MRALRAQAGRPGAAGRLALLLAAGWLAAPAAAAGAPRIAAITGTFVHGETVAIAGAQLGRQRSAPLLWDDFESGAPGAPIRAAPLTGRWSPVDPRNTTYSSLFSHSGSQSLHGARTPASQWANFNVELPDARRFYLTFWFRYRYPPGASGQSKLVQIHGDHQQGDYNPGVMTGGFAGDWWATYIALEKTGSYLRSNYPGEPAQDRWHRVELVLEQSGIGTADGSVIVRIDGRDVYRQIGVRTRELAGRRWIQAGFFTGMTNFGDDTHTWIDDVYLNDGWARVELCEGPSYESCGSGQIQPHLAWADERIVVRFNQGALPAGRRAYLFVVGEDGRVIGRSPPIVIGDRHAGALPPR